MLRPMTRILQTTAAFLLCASATAVAQPMWEMSDRWTCTMEMHMIANLRDKKASDTGRTNSFEIDFLAGTRTSGFVDTVGQITERRYVESVYGRFNMFTVEWDGQPYPNMIVETGGEFWETSASGHSSSDREVWISNYRCEPRTTG